MIKNMAYLVATDFFEQLSKIGSKIRVLNRPKFSVSLSEHFSGS